MSNQAYLQGVAEALSQMNVDPQIKVASYNELEKVAKLKLLGKARTKAQQIMEGLGGRAAGLTEMQRAMPGVEMRGEKVLGAVEGLRGRLGRALASERAGDIALGTAGAGTLGLGALGANALMDDEEELEAERQRNLALALGGAALAGGLGYGAYKAMD